MKDSVMNDSWVPDSMSLELGILDFLLLDLWVLGADMTEERLRYIHEYLASWCPKKRTYPGFLGNLEVISCFYN